MNRDIERSSEIEENLQFASEMFVYARNMGVFANPLEGVEHTIELARRLNSLKSIHERNKNAGG